MKLSEAINLGAPTVEHPSALVNEQLRMEEEAAAEEGAAIENSGYRDPAENVRFA